MISGMLEEGGGLNSNDGATLDYKTPGKARDNHFLSVLDENTLTSSQEKEIWTNVCSHKRGKHHRRNVCP